MPAMLDLVERSSLHAVLSRHALLGREAAFAMRPIMAARKRLGTTLWMAISTQRPHGPSPEQSAEPVRELMLSLWKAPTTSAPA